MSKQSALLPADSTDWRFLSLAALQIKVQSLQLMWPNLGSNLSLRVQNSEEGIKPLWGEKEKEKEFPKKEKGKGKERE